MRYDFIFANLLMPTKWHLPCRERHENHPPIVNIFLIFCKNICLFSICSKTSWQMIKSNLFFTSFILKMSERINSPFALFSLKKSIASFILHSEISIPTVLHPIREKGRRLPPSPQPTSKIFMCCFISLNCDIYGTKYLLLVSASSLKYNLLFFCLSCAISI